MDSDEKKFFGENAEYRWDVEFHVDRLAWMLSKYVKAASRRAAAEESLQIVTRSAMGYERDHRDDRYDGLS